MADYVKRISDLYLLGNHTDGEAYLHTSINELEVIARTAINENYYDIQKILDGTKIPAKSLGIVAAAEDAATATLSRYAIEALQGNDDKIPSALQVKNYIDAAIQDLDARKVDK